MKAKAIAILLVLLPITSFASESLSCDVGPIHLVVGGGEWQVTSCDDGRSLAFATMKGNPAMPFVFFVQRNGKTSEISGEGNGSKAYSAAAFEELKKMTEARFDELVHATKVLAAQR